MYIEKLSITSFGRLNDFELELEPGVNIIEGENESGKSTIAAFIKFMFYGLPPKDRAAVIGWDSSAAAGTLTLRTDTHRYRIERVLRVSGSEERPTYREAVQLVDLSNNMPCHKGESPGELFFGVDSEMFASTAFVSQLGGTSIRGAKLSDGIENLLFSADETVNTQRALERLDAARVLLLHKNGKGGKLYELSNEIAELETRLDTALKTHAELHTKESKLADYREKEIADREKAERLSAKLKVFEAKTIAGLFSRMHALEDKLAELDSCCDTAAPEASLLDQLRSAKIKLDQLNTQLNALPEDDDLPPPSEKLESFKARGRREGLEAEKIALNSSIRSNRAVGIIFALLAAAALAFAGISLAVSSLKTASTLTVTSAVIGAILLALAVTMLITAAKKQRSLESLDAEFDINALETELSERSAFDERAKLNEAMRNGLLSQLDDLTSALSRDFSIAPDSLDEQISKLESAAASTEKLRIEREKYRSMLTQMRSQLGGYDEKEINTIAADTSIDLSDIDTENLPAIRREAEFLKNSARSLAGFTANLEREIAAIHLTDDPSKLESRLNAARDERKQLEKQLAGLKLASEKLAQASAELRESFAPRLAAKAGELLGKITGDKYSELGVGNELAMTCRTRSGQKALGVFSAGTQDAAYLSLRLALCRLIYRRELPPMIYDESFCRMDDQRTRAMLSLLTNEPQSIVLTANSREAHLAAAHNYIKL